MKIKPFSRIEAPDKSSNMSWRKSFYNIMAGNDLWFLFSTQTKAKTFEKQINKQLNDIEEELRLLDSFVYSHYKAANFNDLQKQRIVWSLFESVQNSFFQLYRPYIKWYMVWAHLQNINSQLIEILNQLPRKDTIFGCRATESRLNEFNSKLRVLGLDIAEFVVKWQKGKPIVTKTIDYKNEIQ